ncbi:hypothetical protein SAMN05444483_10280 [Salegentibacter echinorum]|uniref:Uncharacterized protein n=1 Tax=Salegentibacter echinorum TaxID=1073325 RepID=A0A1M5DRP6_SALEC|nr:hypothetical protein [Salegentibacter echinorum]SHF69544.1 hypothetical protein SAMN05444483_10280 [Salegentibacter echinorum]
MFDYFSYIDFHWFLTWIGSICGHILSLYSDDFKGTKPFLRKMFPDKKEAFYFRIDFILLPLIGSLLAFVLLEPMNLKTSLFSGLSWSGTLIAILKNKKTVDPQ